MKNKALNMVLTSICNRDDILDSILLDIENRFKEKLDKENLSNFLNTLDVECKETINVK